MRGLAAVTVALLMSLLVSAVNVSATPVSISEIKSSIEAGASCRQITQASIDRITRLDSGKKGLNAVLEINPDALTIADLLDAQKQIGLTPKPLFCIPVLVQDNYQTADKLSTSAGSLTMIGFKASHDALVVDRLRNAGAVVIGKTNMDEWAQGANGYSSRGGQTHNARNHKRGPGGSSGGSAVSVAAGYVPIATGSDTEGSIQIPANFNGVVGMRSTLGLISRDGIIPSASYMDVPGPIAGSVEDLARVLGLFTGIDPSDPITQQSAGRYSTNYTGYLQFNGLRDARIGVLHRVMGENFFGSSEQIDRAFIQATKTMRKSGATIVDLPEVTVPNSSWLDVSTIATRQTKPELNEWFKNRGSDAPVDSLQEIYKRSSSSTLKKKVKILPTLKALVEAGSPKGKKYDSAVAGTERLRQAVLATLRRYHLDALIFPASSCPPPPLPGVVDRTYSCRGPQPPFKFNQRVGSLASLLSPATGLPVLTLPGPSLPGNIRVGLQLLGPKWSEGKLIQLGYSYEQHVR